MLLIEAIGVGGFVKHFAEHVQWHIGIVGIILHIAFKLQEWQQNELNNILGVHETVQHFLHKHQCGARVVTENTPPHNTRV